MSKLDQLLSDEQPIKHCCGQSGTDVETSKQQIKDLMLELIGEDEEEFEDQTHIYNSKAQKWERMGANRLKRELRQKVEEL